MSGFYQHWQDAGRTSGLEQLRKQPDLTNKARPHAPVPGAGVSNQFARQTTIAQGPPSHRANGAGDDGPIDRAAPPYLIDKPTPAKPRVAETG